jgi:hypothetical protein
LLEDLPNLKLIVYNGRTSNVVDHEARIEQGILLCGTAETEQGAAVRSVGHETPRGLPTASEMAWTLLFAVAKRTELITELNADLAKRHRIRCQHAVDVLSPHRRVSQYEVNIELVRIPARGSVRSANRRRVKAWSSVSVSQFEIQCDFPACSRTLSHGAVRPPLTVTEFRQGVGMLLRAHRWKTDAMGHNLCPYHSQRDDETRIKHDRRQWQRQLMRR